MKDVLDRIGLFIRNVWMLLICCDKGSAQKAKK